MRKSKKNSNFSIKKEEITEEQRKFFLRYGTILAGYSKEEMIELTGHDYNEDDERYEHTELITNKNYYYKCEICHKPTEEIFYPTGQRYPPFKNFKLLDIAISVIKPCV